MHSTVDLQTDFAFRLTQCMLKKITTVREFSFKAQNPYLSSVYLQLTYFCFWLKYFCSYFQNSIVFQPVPLPVLKFGFDSIELTVLPLWLQTAFESQSNSLELYIKWRVTHSWKMFKSCFLLQYCALNLVFTASHECSIIHRLCITPSIAFGSKWRFCCNFPAVKMLPCI